MEASSTFIPSRLTPEQKYQKAPIRPSGLFSEWIMGCGQGISPAAVEDSV